MALLFLGGTLLGRCLGCRGDSGLGNTAGLGLARDLGLLDDGGGLGNWVSLGLMEW